MQGGFFSPAEIVTTKQPASLIPRCGICSLYKRCTSPKMPVYGEGRKGVLIIGESPGRTEDDSNRPFVGESGQVLRNSLLKFDFDLDRDAWTTNAIICRSWQKNDRGNVVNRSPTKNEISYCRPNVIKAIQTLQPDVVILLGGSAIQSVIGWLWKEDPGEVGRWVGWQIPSQRINAWVCPNYHPSFVMRDDSGRENPVRRLLFEKYLEATLGLSGKPWGKVPDFQSRINVQMIADRAATAIQGIIREKVPTAFDFETDRIKPDHKDADIVCCSLSNGKGAIAFPWYGWVIPAMKEFLRSDCPKIGWNVRFESRWSHEKLGVWPRNFVFDGMLAAHVVDNRSEVTSLKFQSFVQLGQESYNDYILPYLKGDKQGGNEKNRVKEADLPRLLTYCGMDSLLEFKTSKILAKKIGVKL